MTPAATPPIAPDQTVGGPSVCDPKLSAPNLTGAVVRGPMNCAPTVGSQLGRRSGRAGEAEFPAGRRIVFVLGSLKLGGSERQALLLADQLRSRWGAEPTVVGFSHPEGRAARACQALGIPCRFLPFENISWRRHRGRWILQWARLVAALRRLRPDVLMPYYALPNLACGLTWRAAGARLCVWNQRDEGLRAHQRLEAMAAQRTPCFIANSPGAAGFLTGAMGVPSWRVHLIPNGVELPDARPRRGGWRHRLNLSPQRFVACMVANLTANKDHACALAAWRRLIESRRWNEPPVLLLAGRHDETADEVRRLIDQWRLHDTVRLLGPVDDVAGLLADCDLAVLASRAEGCPNAVLEAMAAGLPVAGSDIEGIRFAVGDAGRNRLAPPGDDAALAQRIGELIDDPPARRAEGERGRRRVARHFAPERMCDATVELLAAYTNDEDAIRAA